MQASFSPPAPKPFFLPHRPSGALGRFVQFIWIARGQPPHKRERVLPNAVVELIVNLGAPHKVLDRRDYARTATFRNCWLAGIQHQHLVIEAVAETDLLGVRFHPGGAWPLLAAPLCEYTDQVIEFDLLQRSLAHELRERLLELQSDAARIAFVESLLTARLHAQRAPHAAVEFVCAAIRARRGAGRIRDLVEASGLSHRRLMSLFTREVGMTPKALARIARFQYTLGSIAAGPAAPDWSELAHACGYTDQAHFNHEFRALSGLTPTQYLATRLPDFNHTNAD